MQYVVMASVLLNFFLVIYAAYTLLKNRKEVKAKIKEIDTVIESLITKLKNIDVIVKNYSPTASEETKKILNEISSRL
jgi:hypothetical protein